MSYRTVNPSSFPFYFVVGRVEFILFGPVFMLSSLVGIFRRIANRGIFMPLEKELVTLALNSVDRDTSDSIRDQLNSIWQIDRNDSIRSSEDIFRRFVWVFFRIKPRRTIFPEHSSVSFCTITFRLDNKEIIARLSTLNVLLFDISYSKNVRALRGRNDIEVTSIDTTLKANAL